MEVFFIIYDDCNNWDNEECQDLSKNGKMESKIEMDSIFIRKMKESIKVYKFAMKRE
jgi:hypothetical protein